MEPKPLMTKGKAAGLIGLGAAFDAAQAGTALMLVAFLPPLGPILALVIPFLIGIIGMIAFLMCCQSMGLQFIKGKRGLMKVVGVGLGLGLEFVPLLDDVTPGLTMAAVTMVYQTTKEDEQAKKDYQEAQKKNGVGYRVRGQMVVEQQQLAAMQIQNLQIQEARADEVQTQKAREEETQAKVAEEEKKYLAEITAPDERTAYARDTQRLVESTDTARPYQ